MESSQQRERGWNSRQIAWARTVIPGQAVHVERESRKAGHLPHPHPPWSPASSWLNKPSLAGHHPSFLSNETTHHIKPFYSYFVTISMASSSSSSLPVFLFNGCKPIYIS